MANTRIGALWLKSFNKDEKSEQYFSGVLNDLKEDINIVVFKNKNKGEKGPNYIIYRSEEKKEKVQETEDEIIIDDQGVIPDEMNVDNIPY